jgi:cytochrome c oxidase cbb3-type subunit 2
MENEAKLAAGAAVSLGIATAALVVLPYLQVRPVEPPAQLEPYTEAQLRGRQVYIANGCVYCHSQQPRDRNLAPDFERGWGRASVPADYSYDSPHLLGTMRTGPDLLNIGARQPSADWHLGHLYQPRAFVAESNMPSYPYLFVHREQARDGDRVVPLPQGVAPSGTVVVATREALDLVEYLRSLDRTYPILPAADVSAAPAVHAAAR